MKYTETIQILAGDLRPAVTALSKITKRQHSDEARGNILVQPIDRKTVRLTGTDLEFFFTVDLTPNGIAPKDTFTVPLVDIQDRLKGASPRDEITLRPGPRLPDPFPEIPKFRATPVHLETQIVAAIHKAILCASTDQTRYVLQGALLDESGAHTHIVGTDGRHLYDHPCVIPAGLKDSIILPAHKLMTAPLLRVPSRWTLRVSSPANEKRIFRVEAESWSLTGPLIEGNYPNYRQVIPEPGGEETRATIPKREIPDLIKQLQGLSKAKSSAVGLRFDPDRITFLLRRHEDDPFEEFRVPTRVEGKSFTMFANPDHLAKALRFGLVDLEISDESAPLKLSKGQEILITMPVRVSGEIRVKPSNNGSRKRSIPEPETLVAKTKSPGTKSKSTSKTPVRQPVKEPEDPVREALMHVSRVRDSLKAANSGLTGVSSALRTLNQKQRNSEKELRQVRATIRTLRKLKL